MQNMTDRALKERIIGAIVLVVFVILVVPVFLDGPSDEQETISEAVTLPGQNNQQRTQQTVVLDRDRSEPVPAPSSVVETVEKKTQPIISQPVATSRQEPAPQAIVKTDDSPVSPPPASTTSTTGMWAVQLGSFSNQENAERLAAGLRGQGYAAFLSQLQTASGPLHRVRIGPQKDRDGAEEIAAQLGKSGHNGQVVPHP